MNVANLPSAFLLSTTLLCGCAATGGGSGSKPGRDAGASPTSNQAEKYQDCMREMRGDVFAERTCEVYKQTVGSAE